jgi:hypothetical protein
MRRSGVEGSSGTADSAVGGHPCRLPSGWVYSSAVVRPLPQGGNLQIPPILVHGTTGVTVCPTMLDAPPEVGSVLPSWPLVFPIGKEEGKVSVSAEIIVH